MALNKSNDGNDSGYRADYYPRVLACGRILMRLQRSIQHADLLYPDVAYDDGVLASTEAMLAVSLQPWSRWSPPAMILQGSVKEHPAAIESTGVKRTASDPRVKRYQ